jgi:TPR repeat protein
VTPIAASPPPPPPVIQPAAAENPKPPAAAEPRQAANDSKPTAATTEEAAAPAAAPAAPKNVKRSAPAEKPPRPAAPAPKPIVSQPAPEPAKAAEQIAAVAPEKFRLSPPAGDRPAFLYYLDYAHKGNGEATMKVAESYESGRGVAQNGIWACGWYEVAARRGVEDAIARKNAVAEKLQAPERKQCRDFADGQSGSG